MTPLPMVAPLGIAHSALRSYALSLHEELTGRGVLVHHVNIQGRIGGGGPPTQPDTIADRYFTLLGSTDAELVAALYA